MNKQDMVDVVRTTVGEITRVKAEQVVDALFGAFVDAAVAGEDVRTPIGTLTVVSRAARTARNPKTGEAIQVPANKTLKLRANTATKAALA